jgi:hypothetical protein
MNAALMILLWRMGPEEVAPVDTSGRYWRPIQGPSKQTYILYGLNKGLPTIEGADTTPHVLSGP